MLQYIKSISFSTIEISPKYLRTREDVLHYPFSCWHASYYILSMLKQIESFLLYITPFLLHGYLYRQIFPHESPITIRFDSVHTSTQLISPSCSNRDHHIPILDWVILHFSVIQDTPWQSVLCTRSRVCKFPANFKKAL